MSQIDHSVSVLFQAPLLPPGVDLFGYKLLFMDHNKIRATDTYRTEA